MDHDMNHHDKPNVVFGLSLNLVMTAVNQHLAVSILAFQVVLLPASSYCKSAALKMFQTLAQTVAQDEGQGSEVPLAQRANM